MFIPMKSMMSTRPKVVLTYWGVDKHSSRKVCCISDGRGDRLVVVVLLCRGNSFEEDLRWEPKLAGFVDLVELDDVVDGVSVTLSKTVEALRRAFFSSTSVEL